jgi:tripartite-type tricarboxylate transporter receptor subunit TctC
VSRSSAAPELPTVAESGLRGYDVTGWVGVLVPAQTSGDIISKLRGDIAKVLATTDAKARFLSQGAEATTSTPPQFGAFISAEIEKWASVVKKAGITAQ